MTILRQVRSFVRRDSRITDAQKNALESNAFLLPFERTNLNEIFQRSAPCILEIGFGSGLSLLEMAKRKLDYNFIGIETHKPGIGALLLSIEREQLQNIRIFYADAVQVLTHCIPDQSLDGIQIFFPDPWPKRRHHKRRLIQVEFILLITSKLKSNGYVHLATDWEDYAKEMMKIMSSIKCLKNLAGKDQYAERSSHRPVVTKFEKRGVSSGRKILELQFARCFR